MLVPLDSQESDFIVSTQEGQDGKVSNNILSGSRVVCTPVNNNGMSIPLVNGSLMSWCHYSYIYVATILKIYQVGKIIKKFLLYIIKIQEYLHIFSGNDMS